MPNISVEVRIKPNTRNILEFAGNKIVVGAKIYTFSKVHNRTTQSVLFNNTVSSYIERFLGGENCSVLAYGQTGSGKTYTMGMTSTNNNSNSINNSNKGIIHNSLEMIFKNLTANDTLLCSFIEIYNEDIYDLISNERNPLNIRQKIDDINIVGLSEVEISTYEQALSLLQRGCVNRTTKSTKMNSESSRSHAMFTVILKRVHNNNTTESKISFVDLAGSERLKRTECKAVRESISINTGLLSLGNVINALYLKKPHIPFRDSKLTRILQRCLNGYVLLIACVSGLPADVFETTNTLKYASRAAQISLESKIRVENDPDKQIILNLKKEISALKDENNRLRQGMIVSGIKDERIRGHPFVVGLMEKLREYERIIYNSNDVNNNISNDKGLNLIKGQELAAIEETDTGTHNKDTYQSFVNEKENREEVTTLTEKYRRMSFKNNKADDTSINNRSTPSNTTSNTFSNIAGSKPSHANNSNNTINNTVTKKRTRMVTFDLEPKSKNSLFTPLKEFNRLTLSLKDTINEHSAIAFASHEGRMFFTCPDSKIRTYSSNGIVSTVITDEGIRCIYSDNSLYYSTRSLLKECTDTGRPLPVWAYKNEITAMRVDGSVIITGHEDGSLNVVDRRGKGIVFSSRIHEGAIFDISNNNSDIYTCSRDHSVKYSSHNDNSVFNPFVTLMPPHYDCVNKLISFQGKCISLSRDCSLKVWNKNEPFKTVPYAHESWIRAGTSMDECFVTGCKGGIVKCWNFLDESVRCIGKVEVGGSINVMGRNGEELWVSGSKRMYVFTTT